MQSATAVRMAHRDLKLARFDQEIHVDFADCRQFGRDVKRDTQRFVY